LAYKSNKWKTPFFFVLIIYAKSIVKKFGLDGASRKRTPAATHFKLTKDEKGENVD